jgi:hypothetical protein
MDVIQKTRRAIDARTRSKPGRAGASKYQLRNVLEFADQNLLQRALTAAQLDMATATADELNRVNYAIAWSTAWGRPVEDFYAEGFA